MAVAKLSAEDGRAILLAWICGQLWGTAQPIYHHRIVVGEINVLVKAQIERLTHAWQHSELLFKLRCVCQEFQNTSICFI